MIRCVYCGAEVEEGRAYCPHCGLEPRGPWRPLREYDSATAYGEKEFDFHRGASGTLLLGGVLAIIAGVLALGQGLLYMVVGGSLGPLPGSGFICMCGGLDVIFGAASILAGVFAIQRKGFTMAVLGAVLGMLGLGLIVGFFIGLIAVIIIATSKAEFRS